MNVLFLISQYAEAIVDPLIVGLTRIGFVQGRNLIVFPYKRGLFTASPDAESFYGLPAVGIAENPRNVVNILRSGHIDVVFIGAIMIDPLMRGIYEYILEAVGDLPCVMIFEHPNPFEHVWQFRSLNFVAKFLRSKLPDRDGFPISHSIMEERMSFSWPRQQNIFFAGISRPCRDEFADLLTEAGYTGFFISEPHNHNFRYQAYLSQLQNSKVSFVFAETNNNISRRFECPANGVCMFLRRNTEGLEIRDDFKDGQSAVFFTGAEDLLESLGQVLSDEDRVFSLARAGYEHVMNHHLVEHCARYVVDTVKDSL